MATAQMFLKEGAQVFITDYNNETVDQALKTLNATGYSVSGYHADVTLKDEVNTMIG